MSESERVKSILQEPVLNLIAELGATMSEERPKHIVKMVDRHRSEQRTIVEYRPTSGHFDRFGADVLDYLGAALSRLHEEELWQPAYIIDFTNGGRKLHKYEVDQFVAWAAWELFEPLFELMNYQAGLAPDADAFEAWFSDIVHPKVTSEGEHKVLAPLVNCMIDSGRIDLDHRIDLKKEVHSKKEPNSLTIEPMTPEEKSGILTMAANRPRLGFTQFLPEGQFTHAIKVTVAGRPGGKVGERVGDRLLSALRLFEHGEHDFGLGPRYVREPGWLEYRAGIAHISTASKHIVPLVPWGKKWEPDQVTLDEFASFWQRYRDHVTGYGTGHTAVAISRFNQTYQKQAIEDRLLDLAIALEATVLHDISHGESYSFRLPLRGSILVGGQDPEAREEIWNLLRDTYKARGSLVHDGKSVAAKLNMDTREAREFVIRIRGIVARVVLKYLDASMRGDSVKVVNRAVDKSLRSAPWPLGNEETDGNPSAGVTPQ